jgi:hypothetical protein
VVQQGPVLAGSSQATTAPPGWDQWVSLPTPAPELQAGALVKRWDGHMVAGVRGTASRPLRPAPPPCPGRGARRCAPPPLRRHPGGVAAVGGAPRSRRLAQPGAERGAADSWRPGVACLPGASTFISLLLSSSFRCLRACPCGAMLTGFCLLVAGVGAPRPRQVRHP